MHRWSARVVVAVAVGLSLLPAVRAALAGEGAKGHETLAQAGFEEGQAPWRQQGKAEFAVEAEQPHGGRRCARITIPPAETPHWQQWQLDLHDVAEGDAFRATAWVRTHGVADGSGAYFVLEFLDERGQRCGILHSKVNAANGWVGGEELAISGRAAAGAATLRVAMVFNSHGAAWFDDVEVICSERATPMRDVEDRERKVSIRATEVVQPRFGGVGFHVFHHTHNIPQAVLEQVVAKRWRELNPSFARMNDRWDWDQPMLDKVAEHMLRFKATGTELYVATWNPKDTKEGEERAAYARRVVDNLEYWVRTKGITNLKTYCMTNELSLGGWGTLGGDLPKFRDYHRALFDELKARKLDVQLLASDASPIGRWNTIEWATKNMDDLTGVYGGHHYINEHGLDDPRFYPWFLSKLQWGADLARSKGKNFILGEFGSKQDGRTLNGIRRDTCIYWDTQQEPLVALQLAEATVAALNAGIYALGYWTFMDFPDGYSKTYINKWGTFKWSGTDFSTRAHYYAYGLLTRFFRGPATVFKVKCSDPRLRVAALQHHGADSWSVAVVNRNKANVPVAIAVEGKPLNATFRKYVYDPARVPTHPFGDLQGPTGTVAMKAGQLADSVERGSLTVYTTACDDQPPAPVKGLAVEKTPDGKRRLTWRASPEPDLCYYRIYRGFEPNFAPGGATQVASTIATSFLDENAAPDQTCHYKVLAVDQSGNASTCD